MKRFVVQINSIEKGEIPNLDGALRDFKSKMNMYRNI